MLQINADNTASKVHFDSSIPNCSKMQLMFMNSISFLIFTFHCASFLSSVIHNSWIGLPTLCTKAFDSFLNLYITSGRMQATNIKCQRNYSPHFQDVLHMVGEEGWRGKTKWPAESTGEDFTLPSFTMKNNIWTEYLFQRTDLFLVTL